MSEAEMNEKFERKVKLFCILHSNNIENIQQAQIKGCSECRARHAGICNIRYYKGQVVYNHKNGSIAKIKPDGKFERKTTPNAGMFKRFVSIDGEIYHQSLFYVSDVCFGFLRNDFR
jgi:hypothetical protein